MKKAKIMLASLALFVFAGGALAFKAKEVYGSTLFTTTTVTTATAPLADHTTTVPNAPGAFKTYATTVSGGIAQLTWVVFQP